MKTYVCSALSIMASVCAANADEAMVPSQIMDCRDQQTAVFEIKSDNPFDDTEALNAAMKAAVEYAGLHGRGVVVSQGANPKCSDGSEPLGRWTAH